MLKSDTTDVLTVEPVAAKNALVGSEGFTTQSDADASPITLTFTINSVDIPSIFLVQFQVTGIQDVIYNFGSDSNGAPLEPQTPTTVGTTATVYNAFSTPVSSTQIVITLRPAEPNAEVKMFGLYVQACYTPGRFTNFKFTFYASFSF